MAVIRDFIALFTTPSSFTNDPVNWVYNQIGHGYLGVAVTCLITYALYCTTGTYPNDFNIALAVPLGYLILWELDVQGWRGWDTFEDTLFVGAGSGLFVIIDMSEVIGRLTIWILITGVAIFIGAVRRL